MLFLPLIATAGEFQNPAVLVDAFLCSHVALDILLRSRNMKSFFERIFKVSKYERFLLRSKD